MNTGIKTAQAATRTTEYRYNVDGLLEELVCRNGEDEQVTRWEYGVMLGEDGSGVARNDLVRAKVYPDGGTDRVEYSYNRLGEVVAFTDQNGTVHEYTRDVLGRLRADQATPVDDGPVSLSILAIEVAYTPRGEVETVTSYSDTGMSDWANEVAYTYNGFGQVLAEEQSQVNVATVMTVNYTYEDPGSVENTIRRTGIEYPSGRALLYSYSGNVIDERLDRVNAIVNDPEGTPLSAAAYQWLGVGTAVTTGYAQPELEMTLLGGASSGDAGDPYTGLDRFGRLEDVRWRKTTSGNSRVRVQYGFDRVGNRTWRRDLEADSNLFDEHYGYDGLYQVTALNRGNLNQNRTAIGGVPTWAEGWNYDEMGNWLGYTNAVEGTANLDQARLYNAGNELLAINGTNATVAHDPAGNMTRMPAVADWNNDTALVGQTLKWDAWNRLVEVKEGATLVGRYEYDGLNRRITKEITEGGGTVKRHFCYSDQWQVLEERTESGSIPTITLVQERQFVWGIKGIDDLVLRDKFNSGGSLTQRLYSLSDGKNVVATAATDGSVQERYVYTAFGQPTVLDSDFGPLSSTVGWETLYCGYRWDAKSGLYQVRFRDHHPELGRWLSRDPIGEWGGKNLSEAFQNSALNIRDLFGAEPFLSTDADMPPVTAGPISNSFPQKPVYDEETPDITFTVSFTKASNSNWTNHVEINATVYNCNCTDIQFIQIIRSNSNYSWSFDKNDEPKNTWPYPYYPFGPGQVGSSQFWSSTMSDDPGLDYWFHPWLWTALWQEFETCAVCVDGSMALNGPVILGCVSWSHSFSGKTFTWDNIHESREGGGSGMRGSPPSPQFQNLINEYPNWRR